MDLLEEKPCNMMGKLSEEPKFLTEMEKQNPMMGFIIPADGEEANFMVEVCFLIIC